MLRAREQREPPSSISRDAVRAKRDYSEVLQTDSGSASVFSRLGDRPLTRSRLGVRIEEPSATGRLGPVPTPRIPSKVVVPKPKDQDKGKGKERAE